MGRGIDLPQLPIYVGSGFGLACKTMSHSLHPESMREISLINISGSNEMLAGTHAIHVLQRRLLTLYAKRGHGGVQLCWKILRDHHFGLQIRQPRLPFAIQVIPAFARQSLWRRRKYQPGPRSLMIHYHKDLDKQKVQVRKMQIIL